MTDQALTRQGLQDKARKLYKIPEEKLAVVKSVFTKEQLQLLHTATPEEHIHYFPANAGKMAGLPFVTGGYMKHMLDRLTGGLWSFEVKEKGNASGQIWVLGKLTLYKEDGSNLIFKEQFGRANIKLKKGTQDPVDLGNDMKAAATDSLKKCASELGIAKDIYAANEFIEAEIVDRAEVEDLGETNEEPEARPKVKVDEGYKKYVTDLLLDLFPKTYDRTQWLTKVTSKMKLENLTEFEWQFIRGELESLKLAQIELTEDNINGNDKGSDEQNDPS